MNRFAVVSRLLGMGILWGILCWFGAAGSFDALEGHIEDSFWRLRWRFLPDLSEPPVAVYPITIGTLDALARAGFKATWPVPHDLYALALRRLASEGIRVAGFDIDLRAEQPAAARAAFRAALVETAPGLQTILGQAVTQTQVLVQPDDDADEEGYSFQQEAGAAEGSRGYQDVAAGTGLFNLEKGINRDGTIRIHPLAFAGPPRNGTPTWEPSLALRLYLALKGLPPTVDVRANTLVLPDGKRIPLEPIAGAESQVGNVAIGDGTVFAAAPIWRYPPGNQAMTAVAGLGRYGRKGFQDLLLPSATGAVSSWSMLFEPDLSEGSYPLRVGFLGGHVQPLLLSVSLTFGVPLPLSLAIPPGLRPGANPPLVALIGVGSDVMGDTIRVPGYDSSPGILLHAVLLDALLHEQGFMTRLDLGMARYSPQTLLLVLFLWILITQQSLSILPGFLAGLAGFLLVEGGIAGMFLGGYKIRSALLVIGFPLAWGVSSFLGFVFEGREKAQIKSLFGKQVSPEVVEILLSNPTEALCPTRREITVAFFDVCGFTSFSEKHAPERVLVQLNFYFQQLVGIIHGHRGSLDKFIGDALMVTTGAPLADEDHALHMVRIALDIRERVEEINRNLPAGIHPFTISCGVNSGDAVLGNVGARERMEYTVIGDAVNLASRLQGRAGSQEILIGPQTFFLVKNAVRVEPLPPFQVKGKDEPITAYRVMALKETNHEGG